MNDFAIRAEGLSKKYTLGNPAAQYDSVRDLFANGIKLLTSGKKNQPREFWALRDVSFEIGRGENVGIIGLNGAGKSTLLKILSQIVTPTEGQANIRGRLGALLEVGTGFHQELTGRENIFLYGSILGMGRSEVEAKFDQIVEFSEIEKFLDTPVKRYSSGMYVRLAFAVAAHLEPDILLMDEVLAVGDFAFQRKCMDFARSLGKRGSTILFVSHNMFSIKSFCPRVIYLKGGQVVFDGPTDEGLKLYETDNRLSVSPWFHSEDGLPPPIEITDIAQMDIQGVKKTVFRHGERMKIRIRYNASRPVKNPDFRIGIDRADELHCCAFSTEADGLSIPEVFGEGEIELITPPLPIVADSYNTTVTVRVEGRSLISQIGEPFHISHEILQSGLYGVFHQPGAWSISDASQATEKKAGNE